MAAISSAVAEPAVSSITETRYCISDHLLWPGALHAGARSALLRTPLPRSDTASRTSFKDFWQAGRERSDHETVLGRLRRIPRLGHHVDRDARMSLANALRARWPTPARCGPPFPEGHLRVVAKCFCHRARSAQALIWTASRRKRP